MDRVDTSKPVRAELSIMMPEGYVKIIEDALFPEVEKPITERSRVDIATDGDMLRLRIEASDTSALRAALNSYLRWIGAISDVIGSIG